MAAAPPPPPPPSDLAPPPMACVHAFGWGRGSCDLQFSYVVPRSTGTATAAISPSRQPSIRVLQEIHVQRFQPVARPYSYEVIELPDCVGDSDSFATRRRREARAVFTDMTRAMENQGVPDVALQRIVGTLLYYVRNIAAWTLRPGAPPITTQVWAHIYIDMILDEEEEAEEEEEEEEEEDDDDDEDYVMDEDEEDSEDKEVEEEENQQQQEQQQQEGEREDKDRCAICLEGMAGQQRRFLPCTHSFHADCVGRWLLQRAECPMCRLPVTGPAPSSGH